MAITDGIVGCWSPSLGASGYRLLDRSGRGNHGTLTNMDAGTDWVGTSAGLSLDFDGTNDRVVTALSVPTSRMSFSGWGRLRTYNSLNRRICGDADSVGGSKGTDFIFGSSQYYWVLRGGTAADVSITTTVPLATWVHFCCSLGDAPRMYINGSLAATGTGTTFAANSGQWKIGSDDGDASSFDGQIGECCVWSRALTAAEIYDLYRRGNGAIGRELTGQTRRRSYGFVAATGARRRRILCGDYS
jgi:hypothetical protein